MDMEDDKELESLVIEAANTRIRIQELEKLRILLAKEFDEKQHMVSPLTAHIISYEKSTETFISNIMEKLVRVQDELTSLREKLANIERRTEELRGTSRTDISEDER